MKHVHVIALLLWLLIAVTTSPSSGREPDFGKQWIRNHPFTVAGLTQQAHFYSPSQYTNAGFNTFLAWKRFDELLPKAITHQLPWLANIRYDTLSAEVQQLIADAYTDYPGNIGFLVNDEPTTLEMPGTGDIVEWMKQYAPDSLVFTNAFPWGAYDERYYGTTPPGSYGWGQYLDDIISIVQPDVLCYDYYPYDYDEGYASRYFYMLAAIRTKALNAGIPYWTFIQSFARSDANYRRRLPSESDLRMELFTMLTAGYTGLLYFTYDLGFDSGLLDAQGLQSHCYYSAAAANAEVVNLGQSLRYLTSNDMWFVPGRVSVGSPNPVPVSLQAWSSLGDSDPHITNVSVDYAVAGSEGQRKDGLIGFFTDDTGDKYFMLTNVYQGSTMSAAECELSFVIQFDVSVDQLLRLNRITGQQETVILSNHALNLTLPGGTGDLFKYDTGSFVGLEPQQEALSFQDGVNGYTVMEDGYVRSISQVAGYNFGGNTAIALDGNPADTRIGIMKWPNLFGPDPDQIPPGKVISKAMLHLYYWWPLGGDPDAQAIYAYPALVDIPIGTGNGPAQTGQCSWNYRIHNTSGWGSGAPGTGPIAGIDYDTTTAGIGYMPAGEAGDAQWLAINVTDILNAWAGGAYDIDKGFVLICPANFGGYFHAGEYGDTNLRPKLTVEYVDAACGTALYPYPPADLNQDCYVDMTDFAIVSSQWMNCTAPGLLCD